MTHQVSAAVLEEREMMNLPIGVQHRNGRLRTLETKIERGLGTFIEVGQALAEIQRDNLYREHSPTFAEYLKSRWDDLDRVYAYRLIEAATVVKNVANWQQTKSLPQPKNEAQVRPLTMLAVGDQPKAWKRAVELAGQAPVTARIVNKAVEEFLPEPPSILGHRIDRTKRNRTPRRTPQEKRLDCIGRITDMIGNATENMVDVMDSLNGDPDPRQADWAKRMRVARMTLTRFIRTCETARND